MRLRSPSRISRWQLETDRLPQPSSEGPPRILRYPWRGGEPGESRMPYGDSFNVTSSDPLPTSKCFTYWGRCPPRGTSFEYALRLVSRPYFGATLGLERINHVGASVSTGARHCEQIPSHPAFTATPLVPFLTFSSLLRLLGNDDER
jgi:hypothetical protein